MIERLMNKENMQSYLYNKRLKERTILPYAREVFIQHGHLYEGIRAKPWRFRCRRIMCENHDDAWIVTCVRLLHRSLSVIMFTYKKQPAWED